MSVSYFSPRLVHKLGDEVWTGLLDQGLPVQSYRTIGVCVPCVQDAAESSGEHLVRIASHDVRNKCSKFCRHVVCDDHDVTEPLKRDDESYCCGCGCLTIYDCPYLGCLCWVCAGCCAIYHHDEYERIACRHHPRQAPERLDTGEEEELFASDRDPTDVHDQVESLTNDANDIELNEAIDVTQQDLQNEWALL
eukprot:3053332-Amphidinium_carterae.1